MLLERNLTIFDYKVIFAIGTYMRLSVLDQLWSVDLFIKISEIKYKEPEEFNPNGLWFSEVRSVIRAMDYYMLDNDFQTNINYRIILWVWYVNFFWIILFWIVIPITSKDEWGHGLFWRAHIIMGIFLFINFVIELSLFFITIPKYLRERILKSAKGDLQNNARDNWATFLAVVINGWFLISGILAKLDVYTDVAFWIEVLSCGFPTIWAVSFIIFVISISYQFYSFIKLFFDINRK